MRTSVLMATLGLPGWDRYVPSLLGQSFPPHEIIVVIDRPTEEVERAGLAATWPQVRFLFNDLNLGITASLNRGLQATDADILFRADDDDESLPRRFERQLALLAETGADFVSGWAESVNDTGGVFLERCPTGHAEIAAALMRRNVLIHPTLAFRRARVAALGGYDTTFVNAQDYALYLAGLRNGLTFAAVGEPLVRRHYHGDNITVRRRMNQLMYSCAARCVHHAATADRKAFIRTLLQYAKLALTPMWARQLRRRLRAVGGY